MKYIPSINIEYGIDPEFQYIVTPNAQAVTGNLVSNYNSGMHSFSIIGTYGTGKSSYLMALEKDLTSHEMLLLQNREVFGGCSRFEFLNILGDYNSLSNILANKLNCEKNEDSRNIFDALNNYYQKLRRNDTFLFIIIDEFGKILEHAAKNNPESELYFLQRLAEFVNVSSRKIILITTLHQNFGAYAQKLTEAQRNEWIKVKGRFKELVFSEPVEQLLFLASEQLSKREYPQDYTSTVKLLNSAKKARFISPQICAKTINKLYPLDAFSAICITKAIQKYGQNERTLFSFLTATGRGSLSEFKSKGKETYNLSYVYDYIVYNFYSVISEVNSDTTNWTALRVAIERVESGIIGDENIEDALKIVKTIGLLNLFGSSSVTISKELLEEYSLNALRIDNPAKILDILIKNKIIRFASYKSSYILFDGSDIDIEDEMFKAANIVPMPLVNISDLTPFVNQRAISVSEEYYRKGTPRYFEYVIKNEPEVIKPQNDIDGYIQLIFPLEDNLISKVIELSKACKYANIFVVFNNVAEIRKHLYEIHKLQYLLQYVILEDRVAKKEVNNQISYEKSLINKAINDSLISEANNTSWIYNGEIIQVHSYKDFNKLLSKVCKQVYYNTPVLKNELFNKQKLSSAISLAKVKLLDAMLENSDKEDFGFAKDTCPPEKAIYYTIFKDTGIHKKDTNGIYYLGEPENNNIKGLWDTCNEFISSSLDKPRKLTELIKILKSEPIKLKQGVIDFWLPIYLFIKQQDFAIYNEQGSYVMNINKELFEILQKKPGEFSIKAFNVSGIKIEFFKKYRQFLRKDENTSFGASSFIETFKPFLLFYRNLNDYAKNTNKFENASTMNFRNILAQAKDPEKAFFEEMPEALGFKQSLKDDNPEFVEQYILLIRNAVQELNVCYDNLLYRINERLVDTLSLPKDYNEYKVILEQRYKGVKKYLLTVKCRNFLERILAPSANMKEFLEKISNVVIDKKLTQIKDKEEEYLLENLVFLFHELDRYVSISEFDTENEEVFNFELASNTHKISQSQVYRLPEKQKSKANGVAEKINSLLTGDNNLDICILLKLLNQKLDK